MEATEYPANSLFRNILPLSPLNPEIWREFLPNHMIPLDRGRGGYPHPVLTGKEPSIAWLGETLTRLVDRRRAPISPYRFPSADPASPRPAPGVDTSRRRDNRVSPPGSNPCFPRSPQSATDWSWRRESRRATHPPKTGGRLRRRSSFPARSQPSRRASLRPYPVSRHRSRPTVPPSNAR